MAAGQITPKQRMNLTVGISAAAWVQIAETYFELSDAVIKNIQSDNQGNAQAQSREILTKWMYKNSEDQVKV